MLVRLDQMRWKLPSGFMQLAGNTSDILFTQRGEGKNSEDLEYFLCAETKDNHLANQKLKTKIHIFKD